VSSFREVFKRANTWVAAIVIDHHGLIELKSRWSLTHARELFIANRKRVMTEIFISSAANFTLSDRPVACLLPSRSVVLIYRVKEVKDNAEQ
jgi:hypothetical protein